MDNYPINWLNTVDRASKVDDKCLAGLSSQNSVFGKNDLENTRQIYCFGTQCQTLQ